MQHSGWKSTGRIQKLAIIYPSRERGRKSTIRTPISRRRSRALLRWPADPYSRAERIALLRWRADPYPRAEEIALLRWRADPYSRAESSIEYYGKSTRPLATLPIVRGRHERGHSEIRPCINSGRRAIDPAPATVPIERGRHQQCIPFVPLH